MANEDTLKIAADALDTSATPYGDLTVVDRDNRIDVSAEYPLSEQVDISTAGVTRQSSDSVFRIRANASTESLETVERLQYSPGYIAEIGLAIQFPSAPTGDQEVRWGYWDGNDGVYYGWDADGVFVEGIRGGARQGKVYEEDWNGERDINAQELLKNGAITRLILALYNFGTVGFDIFKRNSDRSLDSSRAHNLSVDGQTTLSKQNLPLRVEVDNPAIEDFDVFLADRQATIRGNFSSNRRIKGDRRTSVSLSGTDWVPIMTIRRKSDFESIDVGVFSVKLVASDDVFVQLRSDAGSTADADYSAPQNVTAGETAIEVDLSPSGAISDGQHRFQTLFQGGTGAQSALGTFEGVDLELKRARPFTLFARKVSGTGGSLSSIIMNWEESW